MARLTPGGISAPPSFVLSVEGLKDEPSCKTGEEEERRMWIGPTPLPRNLTLAVLTVATVVAVCVVFPFGASAAGQGGIARPCNGCTGKAVDPAAER